MTNIGDEDLEMKKEELNRISLLLKLNKETLLEDQYNNSELFNKIKELAVSKGGFLDNNYGIIYFIKIEIRKIQLI